MVALVQCLDKVFQPLLNLPHLGVRQLANRFKTNSVLTQEKAMVDNELFPNLFQLFSQQDPATSEEPLLGLLVLGHLLKHLQSYLIPAIHIQDTWAPS